MHPRRIFSALLPILCALLIIGCFSSALQTPKVQDRAMHQKIYGYYEQRNTIGWYKEFIDKYPDSPHVSDAYARIAILEQRGARREKEDQELKRQIRRLVEEEKRVVTGIKIPEKQRTDSLRFVRYARRIFAAMDDYYYATVTDRPGILRKDIDRYNDAIVEATGEVPEELINYVEGTYRAIKTDYLGTQTALTNAKRSRKWYRKASGLRDVQYKLEFLYADTNTALANAKRRALLTLETLLSLPQTR